MASEAINQPINPLKLLPNQQGNKSVRTPAQLEMLAKARVKALEVRKFNASVKDAERQTKNIEATNLKKEVLNKYQKLLEPEVEEPQADSEPEKREIILMKRPKVPKKPKIVYYTDSEDEEEPQPPPILIKKQKVQLPVSVPAPLPKFRNPLLGR
jgi:hypothetical protein